jgi:hypothetical protein
VSVRDDQLLLVRFSCRNQAGDVRGPSLVRLNDSEVIALIEAFEYLHPPFDGEWSDNVFEDINHTITTAANAPGFLAGGRRLQCGTSKTAQAYF